MHLFCVLDFYSLQILLDLPRVTNNTSVFGICDVDCFQGSCGSIRRAGKNPFPPRKTIKQGQVLANFLHRHQSSQNKLFRYLLQFTTVFLQIAAFRELFSYKKTDPQPEDEFQGKIVANYRPPLNVGERVVRSCEL